MKNLIYMGYDVFSILLKHIESKDINVPIIYTLEQEDDWNKREIVTEIGTKLGAEIKFAAPEKTSLQAECEKHSIDHIISAGCPYKVPLVTECRMLNFHPSYLPKGRGRWPVPYYFLGKEDHFGATIHELTDEMDSGPIVCQTELTITEYDNYETAIAKAGIEFCNLLDRYLAEPDIMWQNKGIQEHGTILEFPSDELQTINYGDTVEEISALLKAFSRNELSASWEGKDWLVKSATVAPFSHNYEFGQIIGKFHGNIIIAINRGIIVIHSYRIEE